MAAGDRTGRAGPFGRRAGDRQRCDRLGQSFLFFEFDYEDGTASRRVSGASSEPARSRIFGNASWRSFSQSGSDVRRAALSRDPRGDGPFGAGRGTWGSGRLQENGIVSITVRGAARRPIDAPFLAGRYSIAPGAPYLAAKTGAALLPTHTVRLTDGHYRVTLEPPIDVDGTAAIEAAGQDYARRLEPHVLRDPGQWIDWINI